MRCRGNVRVKRAAAAIRRYRVDEIDALFADGRLDIGDGRRRVHCLVGRKCHVVVENGVAHGKGALLGPRESFAGDNGPMVRHVDDTLSVTVCRRNRYLDCLDVPVFLTVAVLHRIIRIQFEFEQGEAQSGRYRVRPCDVAIEANGDEAARKQACPHGVDHTGYRRVNHVEAGRALPRVMRIAEQDALARFREIATEGNSVAADTAVEVVIDSDIGHRLTRWRRACDSGHEVARAVTNAESDEHATEFEPVDRPHPRCTGAGRGERIEMVRDEAVVAGDEPGTVLAHVLRHG